MISKPWSSRSEIVGTTNRSIAAIPSAWLRRNVLHPCEGGTLLRTIYLATLVWPTSMPSLRSSPWILGAPHNGLATLIWRISWRISTVTAGRPQRCFDFHRQYDLNPARCQRITVSGRTIASAPYILGNSRQTPPNINLSIETNRSLLGLARRSTLICCLSTRISASSATFDRSRSLAIPKISRHKSSIGYQHGAILGQLPARLNLRQGQASVSASWRRTWESRAPAFTTIFRARANWERHWPVATRSTTLNISTGYWSKGSIPKPA